MELCFGPHGTTADKALAGSIRRLVEFGNQPGRFGRAAVAGPTAERLKDWLGTDKIMKIFLSWAGEASQAVALALRDWLPTVLPTVKPWMSSEDIEKGALWDDELKSQLESTAFSIICVVPGNLNRPYLNFEAGALSTYDNSRVAPLLAGIGKDAVEGPLARFQMTTFEHADMYRLIQTINKKTAHPRSDEALDLSFGVLWNNLNSEISKIDFSADTIATPAQVPESEVAISNDEIAILQLISEHGDYALGAENIARRLQQTLRKTQLFLNKLVDKEFLHDDLNVFGETTYGLKQKALEFLMKKGLI